MIDKFSCLIIRSHQSLKSDFPVKNTFFRLMMTSTCPFINGTGNSSDISPRTRIITIRKSSNFITSYSCLIRNFSRETCTWIKVSRVMFFDKFICSIKAVHRSINKNIIYNPQFISITHRRINSINCIQTF